MIIIVMGVSGCGKSTLARALAEALNLPFLEGDNFHSSRSIKKMSQGIPLQDRDRLPWLKKINRQLISYSRKEGCVASCSALKEHYRSLLGRRLDPLYVYLKADRGIIEERMSQRKDHFFSPLLVSSQFAALEEPLLALTVPIELPLQEKIRLVLEALRERDGVFWGNGV